jgi:tripartite ATP-independent transporter DctM subunit
MTSLIMILVFLILAIAGLPICAAMGIGAFVGLWLLDLPLEAFPRYMLHDVKSVPLLAIPFFILAGNLMNEFGLTRRIFDFLGHLVGVMVGGLAQVSVLSSVVFAGISGSALADIAGLGTMQIRAMERAGYRAEFAAALTVATSLMAPIIPPSIMFIIYAVQMNVSVGAMFVAGILPGLMMAAVFLLNNYLLAKLRLEPFPPVARTTWKATFQSFLRGFPALLTPLVILRSMATGLVTPTEASVLAILYATLLGILYREFRFEPVRRAMLGTIRTTTLIMFLTGVGSVMAFVITSAQTAEYLSSGMASLTENKWVILALITFALLVIGSFVETVPAMLISVPLFGPLAVQFGIDPIHFGVVLTFALLLGIIHPPVGIGLFSVCAVTRLPINAVLRASFLFYPALILILLILMFVPSLSTWLPGVTFK